MDRVCSLSTERIGHKNVFVRTLKRNMKKYKTLWVLSFLAIFLCIMSTNYSINQYARAIMKLTIMQCIDLNNFHNLLHDSCLIYKDIPMRKLSNSDCYTCESIERVDVIHNPEDLLESYAELDWPMMYKSDIRANISFKDVAIAFLTGDYLPCDYESNLKIDPLRAIEIKSGWFMHWKNCDDLQGKAMRLLYRPDSFLSISTETWTIMSSNYQTVHFKKINLYYNGRVAVSQINGVFNFQLVPKNPCTEICKNLNGRLEKYHTMIFNSFIWDFQYLPMNNSSASIAIIYYLE